MIPTLLVDQLPRLRHHPAAAGRLSHQPRSPSCRARARRSTRRRSSSCASSTASTSRFVEQYAGLGRRIWSQGDLGYSFEYDLPVNEVVGDRLWLTIIVSFATILFIWRRVVPDRHLLGDAPVSAGAITALTLPRLPRPRDAELPAGAGAALFRQRLVRHLDRRPDGPELHRPALELGQGRVGARASRGSRSS